MELRQYYDLLANVRHDDQFHSIRELVQPYDPEVRSVADVLLQGGNFVRDCQEFVNSFTTYRKEVGDYWTTPAEIIAQRSGDCDDKAILLVSLLRRQIPAEQVFCGFGTWGKNGDRGGHMWVVMDSGGEYDRVIEATAGPRDPISGHYHLDAIFNDQYAFSYLSGIKRFNLLPVVTNGK